MFSDFTIVSLLTIKCEISLNAINIQYYQTKARQIVWLLNLLTENLVIHYTWFCKIKLYCDEISNWFVSKVGWSRKFNIQLQNDYIIRLR